MNEKVRNAIQNVVIWCPTFHEIHATRDPAEIAYHLAAIGYDVRLLTYRDEQNKDLLQLGKVKVTTLRKRFSALSLIDIPLYYYITGNRKSIDCLILYFAGLSHAIACMLYKLLKRRGICIVKMDSDGNLYDNAAQGHNPARRILARLLGELSFRILSLSADLIIIESPEAKQRVLVSHSWLKEKLIVLPNGVNVEKLDRMSRYSPSQKENKILYVGRIEYAKGVDLLIRAFSRLKDNYPEWNLELVGEIVPAFENELGRELSSAELTNKILITGPLSHNDLAQRYLEARIFCLPSRQDSYSYIGVDYHSKPRAKPVRWRESFGLVLVEAAYFGDTVVSSDVGAARYVLDYGKAGMIFESGNLDELTTCLNRLMGDSTLRDKLAEAARLRCLELFNWVKIVKDLDHYISRIAGKAYSQTGDNDVPN